MRSYYFLFYSKGVLIYLTFVIRCQKNTQNTVRGIFVPQAGIAVSCFPNFILKRKKQKSMKIIKCLFKRIFNRKSYKILVII